MVFHEVVVEQLGDLVVIMWAERQHTDQRSGKFPLGQVPSDGEVVDPELERPKLLSVTPVRNASSEPRCLP
jgi:hypothetical protein